MLTSSSKINPFKEEIKKEMQINPLETLFILHKKALYVLKKPALSIKTDRYLFY